MMRRISDREGETLSASPLQRRSACTGRVPRSRKTPDGGTQFASPRIKKGLSGAVFSALLILADQLTKAAAVRHLKGGEPFVIWDGVFELRYLENRGAAFGILQDQRWFFIVLTAVVLLLILYLYLFRIPGGRHFSALNLIAILFFAGAAGNFIDRIRLNYVVDFFYFKLIDFPIFNVADICVTVGAFLFLFFGIFYYKDEDYEQIFPSRGGKPPVQEDRSSRGRGESP